MAKAPKAEEVWDMMLEGSDDLADEIGLDTEPFTPPSLPALDDWVQAHDGDLDDEDVTLLGLFLARLLVEHHGGGLLQIQADGHPLDGEWALSGFSRGLASDYHVPFMVSAQRIARRDITAAAWYAQLLKEGR